MCEVGRSDERRSTRSESLLLERERARRLCERLVADLPREREREGLGELGGSRVRVLHSGVSGKAAYN